MLNGSVEAQWNYHIKRSSAVSRPVAQVHARRLRTRLGGGRAATSGAALLEPLCFILAFPMHSTSARSFRFNYTPRMEAILQWLSEVEKKKLPLKFFQNYILFVRLWTTYKREKEAARLTMAPRVSASHDATIKATSDTISGCIKDASRGGW